MSKENVLVLEISNVNEEDIQVDLGKAFQEFCSKHKGAGVKASILSSKGSELVRTILDAEGR